MKNKIKFFFTMAFMPIVSLNLVAQSLPSYIPTNDLVAWYSFNGNANDGSGNGLNGIVNNGTFGNDRYGNNSSCFNVNGNTNRWVDVSISDSILVNQQAKTFSVWAKLPVTYSSGLFYNYLIQTSESSWMQILGNEPSYISSGVNNKFSFNGLNPLPTSNFSFNTNTWYHIVCVCTNNFEMNLYINGQFIATQQFSSTINFKKLNHLRIGNTLSPSGYSTCAFPGQIDDVGIWNRALTQQEITKLYKSVNCNNDLSIAPIINPINKGTTVTLTALTSDSNMSFIWQSDFNQGFQTLNNYGNYSGTNTDKMLISDIKLSNHLQPIRAISISENCTDTSNTVYLTLADTCISKVYDTTYISVTDTLIIKAKLTGLNQINEVNTIKVYPNPANTHIYIDNGNYSMMQDYTIKITSSIGQTVFSQKVDKQQVYIDLSGWSGTGTYVLQIIDKDGVTIETKKIILNN